MGLCLVLGGFCLVVVASSVAVNFLLSKLSGGSRTPTAVFTCFFTRVRASNGTKGRKGATPKAKHHAAGEQGVKMDMETHLNTNDIC